MQNFLGTINYIKSLLVAAGDVSLDWAPGNSASIDDYIKDGLVLHLDGIKNTRQGHDSSSTTWENLVDSDLFGDGTLYGGTSFTNDALYVDGTPQGTGVLFNDVVNLQNITVEVVVKRDDTVPISNSCIVGNPNGAGFGLGDGAGTYWHVWWARSSYPTSSPTDTYTLYPIQPFTTDITYLAFSSGTTESSVYNNNLLKMSAPAETLKDSPVPWAVGANSNGTTADTMTMAFKGHIYSIRVYNRQLTDDEISYNNAIDRQRFNIKQFDIDYGSNVNNYYKEANCLIFDGIDNTESGHSDSTNIWYNHGIAELNASLKRGAHFDSNSLVLNGIDQSASVGLFNTEYVTVDTVIKYTAIPETVSAPVNNFAGGGYGYYPTQNKWAFMAMIGNEYKTVELDTPFNIDEIFTSTATFDGKELYLDTDKYGQKTLAISGKIKDPAYTNWLCIGGNAEKYDTNAHYVPGHIYAVRVYKSSTNRIIQAYNRLIDKARFKI